MCVTYPVDVSSLAVVRSKPKHLLEVLESLLHVILVVETESADVDGIGTHAIHTQNVAENSTPWNYNFTHFFHTKVAERLSGRRPVCGWGSRESHGMEVIAARCPSGSKQM